MQARHSSLNGLVRCTSEAFFRWLYAIYRYKDGGTVLWKAGCLTVRQSGASAGLKPYEPTCQTDKPTVTGRKLVRATKSFGNVLYVNPNLFRGRDLNFNVDMSRLV